MGDLSEILARKNYSEPPEISALKSYIKEHFDAEVAVSIRDDVLVLKVKSSALAGTLRMHSEQIIKSCGITKKLILKIG